ncbi:hypothetical protein G4V62_18730 [Bacillaceae bacterium SIJ1]|uniref:hypothetical protein n=1 Tax=Litoribacterium kuwaitense TaxID=1398745 RepID=UPI0013EE20D6|nr:hypothetical protein [Litoribacterium kuwaitense]NGP46875.1 hypothetical protein [Litoribacterium kuwaitense]
MSLDRYRIERAVLFRVRGIEKINSIESGVGTISLFVGNKEGQATEEMIDLTKQIVEKNRPIGTRVLVEPFSKSPFQNKGLYELPNEIRNAHISSLTHSDIEFLVKNCVPNVVYFDSKTVKGGVIDVFVADINLEADVQMLDKTQKVLNDVFHSDVTISVSLALH